MKKLILIAFLLSACATSKPVKRTPESTEWDHDEDEECKIIITNDSIPNWYAYIPTKHKHH